jgi:hypothetical protein
LLSGASTSITRVAGARVELFSGDRVQFETGVNPRTGKSEAQNVTLIED